MDVNNTNQEIPTVSVITPDTINAVSKPKNSKKLLFLLCIIVMFLLIGISAYIFIVKNNKINNASNNLKIVSQIPTVTLSPTPLPVKLPEFIQIGESMYPNYKNKQVWLYEKYTSRQPERYDVVFFDSPVSENNFIKRIIGLPTDTILLKDGSVYLNGQLLDESKYVNSEVKTYGGYFLRDGAVVTVPQGNFFVMGDNRQYSSDSREWGFLPEDSIIGKITTKIQPSGATGDKCSCWDSVNSICLPQTDCQ